MKTDNACWNSPKDLIGTTGNKLRSCTEAWSALLRARILDKINFFSIDHRAKENPATKLSHAKLHIGHAQFCIFSVFFVCYNICISCVPVCFSAPAWSLKIMKDKLRNEIRSNVIWWNENIMTIKRNEIWWIDPNPRITNFVMGPLCFTTEPPDLIFLWRVCLESNNVPVRNPLRAKLLL